jgi:hypothetical protein
VDLDGAPNVTIHVRTESGCLNAGLDTMILNLFSNLSFCCMFLCMSAGRTTQGLLKAATTPATVNATLNHRDFKCGGAERAPVLLYPNA